MPIVAGDEDLAIGHRDSKWRRLRNRVAGGGAGVFVPAVTFDPARQLEGFARRGVDDRDRAGVARPDRRNQLAVDGDAAELGDDLVALLSKEPSHDMLVGGLRIGTANQLAEARN